MLRFFTPSRGRAGTCRESERVRFGANSTGDGTALPIQPPDAGLLAPLMLDPHPSRCGSC